MVSYSSSQHFNGKLDAIQFSNSLWKVFSERAIDGMKRMEKDFHTCDILFARENEAGFRVIVFKELHEDWLYRVDT